MEMPLWGAILVVVLAVLSVNYAYAYQQQKEENKRLTHSYGKFSNAVLEFHCTFDVPILAAPGIPDAVTKELRKKLITEECTELIKALDDDDLIAIADGIADLHYVVSGTALSYGIPEDAVFDEVHRSNMSKADPDGTVHKREDGKILKSIHYTPANIKAVLEQL
jgi:predicted HAD superfamily Cof-like phosphohydrolase